MHATPNGRGGETRKYFGEIGDRARIGIGYRGGWRPMFWFPFGRDGSLYLGPRFKTVWSVRKGFTDTPGRSVKIDFDAGELVTSPQLVDGTKLSFHASGLITSAGERLWRPPLRDIRRQTRLLAMIFQHPTAFRIERPRWDDIVIDYPLDEGYPLQCAVYLTPPEKTRRVVMSEARYQVNLAEARS